MSISFDSISKIVVEDVEKINTDKYFLNLGFIEEEINRKDPNQIKIWKIKVHASDSIKTLSLAELVEKIKEIAKEIDLRKIEFDSPMECEYFQMPSKYSKVFFNAIRQLQDKVAPIFISKYKFEYTLRSLEQHHFITYEEAKDFKATIKTHLTFEEHTHQTQNVTNAVSMAYHYRYKNQDRKWLRRAKEYLNNSGKKLSNLINVSEFLTINENIDAHALDLINIFEMDEKDPLLEKIRKLEFNKCCYRLETYEQIGLFLKKTTLIEKVDLSKDYICRNLCIFKLALNSSTVSSIANALLTNSSITLLNVANSRILDEGVTKIVSAIENNPKSRIMRLNFFDCGMTSISVDNIKRLINKKEQIIGVNIHCNEISNDEVQTIKSMTERNLITFINRTREFMLDLIRINDLINIVFDYLDLSEERKNCDVKEIDADDPALMNIVRPDSQIELTENKEEEFNI